MEFTFRISDLKKSLPRTENFDALTGAELQAALRRLLGDVAANADLRVEGDLVTVTPKPVSRVYLDEAQRFYEKAGMPARKGEFEKAAGIYRRILEIDPSRNDARRELAMVLVAMGDTEGAKNLLLDERLPLPEYFRSIGIEHPDDMSLEVLFAVRAELRGEEVIQ